MKRFLSERNLVIILFCIALVISSIAIYDTKTRVEMLQAESPANTISSQTKVPAALPVNSGDMTAQANGAQ